MATRQVFTIEVTCDHCGETTTHRSTGMVLGVGSRFTEVMPTLDIRLPDGWSRRYTKQGEITRVGDYCPQCQQIGELSNAG